MTDARQAQPSDPQFPPPGDPSTEASLVSRLTYGLSLPERTVRSTSAMVGGIIHESAGRLIPATFRSSRSYSLFVQQALNMMVHDIGGVSNPGTSDLPPEESKLAQKAVGGLLDVAGAATLHLSPLTVLAIFNDVAYGSGHFLGKLSEELKREGIIDADSSIDRVADLVQALQNTSSRAAEAIDTPPISVSGLTETIRQISTEVARVDPTCLLPQHELEQMWTEMEQAASQANVGLWDVSTAMTMFAMNRITLTSRGALSTFSVVGNLLDQHIVRHYADALDSIGTQGLYATLEEASAPYLEAVWLNFDATRDTWTEAFLSGRLFGKAWTGIRGWWNSGEAALGVELDRKTQGRD